MLLHNTAALRRRILLAAILMSIIALYGCHHSQNAGTTKSGATTGALPTPVRFIDVTAQAHIDWTRSNGAFGKHWMPESLGGGCAFIDYDNDGYQDILLVNGDWWPGHPLKGPRPTLALYHNNHDGTFTDVTTKMGLNIPIQGMGIAIGDYDNDGYDDILITGVGGNHLFHNAHGTGFRDVTRASGLAGTGWTTSAAWVDYDNDGKLDLFVCHYVKWTPTTDVYCGGAFKIYCTPDAYDGDSCHLYHNDGNGHFTDVTVKSGLYNPASKALGICTVDLNNDGKVDLLVANDAEPNLAYRNLGNGKYKDISNESGLALGIDGKSRNGMGIDAADFQNDGSVGILVGNFSFQGAALFHEVQPGMFQDIAREAGIQQPSYHFVTFGVLYCDLNNDGWRDAVITNGHTDDLVEKSLPGQTFLQPTQIFLNRGGGAFSEADAGPGLQKPAVGRGIAWGDYDNDGRPDLLMAPNSGPPRLLHNETDHAGHWLTAALTGTKSNRDGYGAVVRLSAGGVTQTDYAHSGSSYCSQSDRRLHFGLGPAKTVDSIEIRWPSGAKDLWRNLDADRVYYFKEGQPPRT